MPKRKRKELNLSLNVHDIPKTLELPKKLKRLNGFYQVLVKCHDFLDKRAGNTSVDNVISLANSMVKSRNPLTLDDVRLMEKIGTFELKEISTVYSEDDFESKKKKGPGLYIQYWDSKALNLSRIENRCDAFRCLLFEWLQRKYNDFLHKKGKTVGSFLPSKWDEEFLHDQSTDLNIEEKDENHKSQLEVASSCKLNSIDKWLQNLKSTEFYCDQIKHIEDIPMKTSVFGTLKKRLKPSIETAIKSLGIDQLYVHQCEAIDSINKGQDVAISTSTSSGKSLVFNVSVTSALLDDPEAVAVYVFPTKALAQDQLQSLRKFLKNGNLDEQIKCCTMDGDTPKNIRTKYLIDCRIFLTNPDMLHITILKNHPIWAKIFHNLKFVIIDEAHVYRGIFGSHVANILRRLWRLCFFYDSKRITPPQVICCSATILNPKEHFQLLIPCMKNVTTKNFTMKSRELVIIENDGSPVGRKLFVIWNPPLKNNEEENEDSLQSPERLSAIWDASQVLHHFVEEGIRTLLFCRGRKLTEVLLYHVHSLLKQSKPHLMETVKSYRGGYTTSDRRSIEEKMFTGTSLLGIIATNALELGIDIGILDATIQLGFPSSISSMWQQAGRAGRKGKESISIIVCFDSPLDQYLVRKSKEMLNRQPEAAILDPNNVSILKDHLLCAASEFPINATFIHDPNHDQSIFQLIDKVILFTPNVPIMYSEDATKVMDTLIASNRLRTLGKSFRLFGKLKGYGISSTAFQHRPMLTNIRAIEPINFKVIDENERTLDTIPARLAKLQVYPNAIYLHQGKEYLITKLDSDQHVAYAKSCQVSYTTKPRDFTDVNILRITSNQPEYSLQIGQIQAITRVIGYRKYRKKSGILMEVNDFTIQPFEYESCGIWINLSDSIMKIIEKDYQIDYKAAIHGVNHLLQSVIPLFVLSDPGDIRTEHYNIDERRKRPHRLMLYENQLGGIGIIPQIQKYIVEICCKAKDIIETCPCDQGCPGCVHDFSCGEFNHVINKQGAKLILQHLVNDFYQYHIKKQLK